MAQVLPVSAFTDVAVGTLPSDVLCMINSLTSQVGAPEYERTPQFNRTLKGARGKRGSWDKGAAIIPATKLTKRVGIDGEIDKIRVLLNKLTDKTYDSVMVLVQQKLNEVSATASADDMSLVFNTMVNLMASNGFYFDVHARLMSALSNEFAGAKAAALEFVATLNDKLDTLRFVDPNEDYDLFCEINKENEKRRASVTFAAGLAKHSVIEYDAIKDLIFAIQKRIRCTMTTNDSMPVVDELTELLSAAVSCVITCGDAKTFSFLTDVRDDICIIASTKARTYPGLSHKSVFKHMDMRDLLEESLKTDVGKVCA